MSEPFGIVLLDEPTPANSNGEIRRRVGLRVGDQDVDVLSLRLGSDTSRTRQAKKWAGTFNLDATEVESRLRSAAVLAAEEAQNLPTRAETVEGAKSPPPPPLTLNEARRVFRKWIRNLDPDLLDVVFAVVMAHSLDGDPVWIFIIAAPGDGKTEVVRAFSAHPLIYVLSTLTPGSLISGFIVEKGPDPSLLPKLDGKVLVVKDFTAILTMPNEARTEILGTLRDAFDGEAAKAFGTGEVRKYRSRFGLVAAVTPVIDRYWGVSAQLGERFLRFRMAGKGRAEKVAQAISNATDETAMRQELSATALAVLAQSGEVPSVPTEIERQLVYLADFVSLARSEVSRDRHGVVEYVPAPEIGTRVGKQLKKLSIGIAMARGLSVVDAEVIRIVRRVAEDTIPSMRARLIRVLWSLREALSKTAEIGDAAEIPTDTAKVWLDDLRLLGIADRGGDQHSGYSWRMNATFVATIDGAGLVLCPDGDDSACDPPSDFAPQTQLALSETGSGVPNRTPPPIQNALTAPDVGAPDGSDLAERAAVQAVEEAAETDPRIPAGWSKSSWVARLRQLADVCETHNPKRAAELRADADAIEGGAA